jgi:hypothetical protein
MAHVRDAGRNETFVEVAARRNAQAAIMQPRTAAAFGPIAFVGDGLIDERRGDVAPAAARVGDATWEAAVDSAFGGAAAIAPSAEPSVLSTSRLQPSVKSSPSINPTPELIHLFMTRTPSTAML